jgi:hypothetical protein
MTSVLAHQKHTPTAKAIVRYLFGILVTCLFLVIPASAQQADAPLTNTSIIKLVRAGFKEKTIITIIHSRPNHFNLDTEQLILLKHNDVSENIILAMLSQGGAGFDADYFSDDAFFKDKNKGGDPGGAGPGGSDPGTNIFGSGSGSRSQTRQRGARGGNDTEGNITGSATVRIIRPPTEAGGTGSLKLEKTPTLDNDAVIRMVDAGFSEGTIIKRIEDSPAAFDLSAPKIEELHKRRVTDTIIAAMTAAMSDKDGEAKPIAPQDKER